MKEQAVAGEQYDKAKHLKALSMHGRHQLCIYHLLDCCIGALADLSLDINVDPMTAAKIREVTRMKEQAVAAEDYDEAKHLKATIERLKAVGQKVLQ